MSGRRGYAIGHLRRVQVGPDVRRYLEEIEATMEPFGGEFLVHGTRAEVLEGPPVGDVIVIGFPSVQAARDWYASPAYQAILPLRTDHAESNVVLLEGVAEGYRTSETVAKIFGAVAPGSAIPSPERPAFARLRTCGSGRGTCRVAGTRGTATG